LAQDSRPGHFDDRLIIILQANRDICSENAENTSAGGFCHERLKNISFATAV